MARIKQLKNVAEEPATTHRVRKAYPTSRHNKNFTYEPLLASQYIYLPLGTITTRDTIAYVIRRKALYPKRLGQLGRLRYRLAPWCPPRGESVPPAIFFFQFNDFFF
jgi:hypothetical protein